MLNTCIKGRTGLRQTGALCNGPCRAKPRPASPNHHIKQKWEQSTTEVNRHNPLFLEICPSYIFSKRCYILEASSVSIFRQRSTNLVDSLHQAILSQWAT